MSGHTPGPWRYQEESDAYTHIVRAGDRFLCQLQQDTTGEAEANGRLMAAAPDLADALEALVEPCPTQEDYDHAVDGARAALRKAGRLP